jgi:hypothetical protein
MPGSQSKINRNTALEFARLCVTCCSVDKVANQARQLARGIHGDSRVNTWKGELERFANAIESQNVRYSIFAIEGNSKLPFCAFSTLPIVTCPGAGSCAGIEQENGAPNLNLAFCYSLRAWRYPSAFLRQCQNTLLLRFYRQAVVNAFEDIPKGATLRLYVDGDFDSASTASFWFSLLRQRPDVKAYGYSKSWRILSTMGESIPDNYILNLSSGGIDDGNLQLRETMRRLKCTRGEFVAVKLSRKHGKSASRYQSLDYHRDVRESALSQGFGKVFSCPGRCGECTGKGHACGEKIDGRPIVPITIAIGIH